jgi:hypothetical protein
VSGICRALDVGFWHLTDITVVLRDTALRTRADIIPDADRDVADAGSNPTMGFERRQGGEGENGSHQKKFPEIPTAKRIVCLGPALERVVLQDRSLRQTNNR